MSLTRVPPSTWTESQFARPELEVYPNPTSGHIYISGLTLGSRVVVSNIQGSIVRMVNAEDVVGGLSLSDQPAGMYFISVIDNDSVTRTARVVKK